VYKIGEFSRLSQIPVKTLRYYDGLGVLRPAHVSRATGYRYYTAAQFERLNRILVLKDLGFSLREMRALLAEHVPAARLRALLRRKRDEVERRVDQERARLARVAARLDAIERGDHPGAHDVAVRRVGPRLVASTRRTLTSYDECDALLDELGRRLGPSVAREEPAAIWHAGHGAIDCEALVFLAEPVAPVEGVSVYEMPAHTAACLVYRGDENYPRAFAAIRDWLVSSGVTVTGPKRERYLGDGDEPVTEIQYPIVVPTEERRDA
jgi:DNA-binding transcriptional MerR regulator